MALIINVRTKDGNYIPIPYVQGLSAYDIYKKNLPEGAEVLSEKTWLDSLKAGSVYEAYVETVPAGTTPKSEAEFYESLITSTTLVTAFDNDVLKLANGGTGVSLTDVKQLRPLIDAAAVDHTHTAAEVGAAALNHTHALADLPISYGTTAPNSSTAGRIYFKI